jgi:hypothetical protein
MIDNRPATHSVLDDQPATPQRAPARTRRAKAPASLRRRLSFFIHEPFGSPPAAWRVGVIADGTTRGGPNGIADGARRVVECAERCAERGDVRLFAACILSPKNLRRRKRTFFAALHAEFLRLAERVESGHALAGVRIEIHGRLDRLAEKGEAAARLADVLELLCEKTAAIPSPRLRLVFCIDYDEDTPLALGLDVLIRTGMEERSVLRLSGLRVQPWTACIPYVTLWRNFTAADLDHALALAARHARPGLATGFSNDFLAELLSELSLAGFSVPMQIILPLAASAAETAAVLEGAASGPLNPASGVAVVAELPPRGAPRRVGSRHALVQVQLVRPGLRRLALPGDPVAWLAPGQPSRIFHLQERSAGDANIHVCESTPAGVIAGLRHALRFHEAHPPLHGAPRPPRSPRDPRTADSDRIARLMDHVSGRTDVPADVIARELDGPDVPGIGEIFAAQSVVEARRSGLISGEVDWQRQALGYAMTAFAIGIRPPDAIGVSGSDWEPATRAVARVMLALASSDEEITDRMFPGEGPRARRTRLAASIDYLNASIRGEAREPPDVCGKDVLQATARTWNDFFALVTPAADETLLAGVKQAAEAVYVANIEELSRADRVFTALERRPSPRSAAAVERRYTTSAPEPIAYRIRELLQVVLCEPQHGSEESWRELRLLCRLSRVAPSIGAGCALLAMAATEPARAIPAGGAAAFLQVTPLLDYYFRLANDLAFSDATRGDRDSKSNTFTCLIPAGLTGKAREQASVAALVTCRATAAWLERLIDSAVGALSRLWPLGARWLRRGIHVGHRAYEIGHYERLAPEAIAGIVAEIELPAAGRFSMSRPADRPAAAPCDSGRAKSPKSTHRRSRTR